MSFDLTQLAHNVRALRRARGMTQATLAELAGVTDETVSRVERGAFEPSLSTTVAIAMALEVSVDELIGRRAGDGGLEKSPRRPLESSLDQLSAPDRHLALRLLRRLMRS